MTELTDEQRKNLVITKCLEAALEQLDQLKLPAALTAAGNRLHNAKAYVKTASRMLNE